MSLADLTNKIEADAQKNKGLILQDSDKKCELAVQEYAQKQFTLRDNFSKETQNILKKNLTKVIQGAERKAKQSIDRAKREKLDEVFQTLFNCSTTQ